MTDTRGRLSPGEGDEVRYASNTNKHDTRCADKCQGQLRDAEREQQRRNEYSRVQALGKTFREETG